MSLTDTDWFLVLNYGVAFAIVSYFAIRAERAERKLEQRKNRRVY